MNRKERIMLATALSPAVVCGLLLGASPIMAIGINTATFLGIELGCRVLRRRHGLESQREVVL